ncbi:unnamed protein product [Gadus morhua 'NCC']
MAWSLYAGGPSSSIWRWSWDLSGPPAGDTTARPAGEPAWCGKAESEHVYGRLCLSAPSGFNRGWLPLFVDLGGLRGSRALQEVDVFLSLGGDTRDFTLAARWVYVVNVGVV